MVVLLQLTKDQLATAEVKHGQLTQQLSVAEKENDTLRRNLETSQAAARSATAAAVTSGSRQALTNHAPTSSSRAAQVLQVHTDTTPPLKAEPSRVDSPSDFGNGSAWDRDRRDMLPYESISQAAAVVAAAAVAAANASPHRLGSPVHYHVGGRMHAYGAVHGGAPVPVYGDYGGPGAYHPGGFAYGDDRGED